jgi:proteasome accessory factor C
VTEVAYGRLGRRLRRILVMLPYAIQHPGVSVDELARKFGVAQRDLLEDLNLVFLCGLPGYGPGDLIDVTVDADRVYVRTADYFSAPLRLSPAEALSLYAAGEALAALGDMEEADALKRALVKLRRAIGVGAGDGPSGVAVQVEAGPEAHLETLRGALAGRRKVRMEYLSQTRGELTHRTVDPWGLIVALGRWYLVGWDHLAGDERMFRIDRVKSVEALDSPAEAPEDFDPQRYRGAFRGGGDDAVLALEISPAAARWFEEYYPVSSSSALEDGWRHIELSYTSERWAATLLLRLGHDVRNVTPESVTEEAGRLAAAIAGRHGAAA